VCLIHTSSDHTPNQTDEWQWIEDAGSVVKWNNTITTCWLVEGVLGLSPAFGAGQLQQFVMAENEIQEDTTEGVDFLVLATAGLWNVVSIRMQCEW
jgi:serine/threonine protein phosphatase PrpC